MVTAKTDKDLKSVLMVDTKAEVKLPYYEIADNDQAIFVVTAGKNGAEFNKTVGYFNNFPGMQTYQCLYGQGVFIIQRNDEFGEAKEFKVFTLNPGRQVLVPAGWGMCIVNTGITSYLVVLRNSILEDKNIDQKPVIQKRGFAYYIVEKKGEIGFEQNPNYKIHPQITAE